MHDHHLARAPARRLRIGNGTIDLCARPTKKNPPPFHFHGEFPPFELVGNRVLQLEDGALRVWRAPDGTLMQGPP